MGSCKVEQKCIPGSVTTFIMSPLQASYLVDHGTHSPYWRLQNYVHCILKHFNPGRVSPVAVSIPGNLHTSWSIILLEQQLVSTFWRWHKGLRICLEHRWLPINLCGCSWHDKDLWWKVFCIICL